MSQVVAGDPGLLRGVLHGAVSDSITGVDCLSAPGHTSRVPLTISVDIRRSLRVKEDPMRTGLGWRLAMASVFAVFLASLVAVRGQGGAAVAIDSDDIGGVVTGAQGPEAGVWVIAETRSTPTRLIKSVVTDDRGRFVVPDLPSGEYDVWVRGYGLVDSPKVKSSPGKTVNLKAVPAPDKKAAAQYYPALYWFSLLQV